MPKVWYNSNSNAPADHPRNEAEINAVVAYLFANSETYTPAVASPPRGNAQAGEQIVRSIGCLGCHIIDENDRAAVGPRRTFGQPLKSVGSKTTYAWLYNWVRDPRHYNPGTYMPDLRLTDQEAADIASWLMTLQKPTFMQRPLPAADAKAVGDLTKSYLVNTMTDREADAKLRTMPVREQLVFLGERSIEKYGCYSCHSIKGFETMKPIGTELTTEGSKNPHLFDFGFVHEHEAWDGKKEVVHHTVPSWIYNKLRSPRVWDEGREKRYHEKLKMPNYYLSPKEAEAITSVIVGLTKDRVSEKYLAAMSPADRCSRLSCRVDEGSAWLT